MFILVNCNNIFFIFLCLELQSLCFYILASYKKRSFFSLEAGLKYFILGSLSSGFLLFSIAIIFGCTGLINFTDLEYFFFNFNLDECVYLFLEFYSSMNI